MSDIRKKYKVVDPAIRTKHAHNKYTNNSNKNLGQDQNKQSSTDTSFKEVYEERIKSKKEEQER